MINKYAYCEAKNMRRKNCLQTSIEHFYGPMYNGHRLAFIHAVSCYRENTLQYWLASANRSNIKESENPIIYINTCEYMWDRHERDEREKQKSLAKFVAKPFVYKKYIDDCYRYNTQIMYQNMDTAIIGINNITIDSIFNLYEHESYNFDSFNPNSPMFISKLLPIMTQDTVMVTRTTRLAQRCLFFDIRATNVKIRNLHFSNNKCYMQKNRDRHPGDGMFIRVTNIDSRNTIFRNLIFTYGTTAIAFLSRNRHANQTRTDIIDINNSYITNIKTVKSTQDSNYDIFVYDFEGVIHLYPQDKLSCITFRSGNTYTVENCHGKFEIDQYHPDARIFETDEEQKTLAKAYGLSSFKHDGPKKGLLYAAIGIGSVAAIVIIGMIVMQFYSKPHRTSHVNMKHIKKKAKNIHNLQNKMPSNIITKS
jgi:hypothetical protein